MSKKVINKSYLSQLENYETMFNVFYGGAGSGKSHFAVQKLIYKYLKYPNRKCLVVRKVSNTLRDSIFALFKSVLGDWKLYEQCKVNKTDMTIELPNGSHFIFKGIDDPEKIKSIANIDDIVVEECTEIDVFDFDQLVLRLRSRNGYNQIHVMFNPVSKSNWVYKRWFENGYNKSNTVVLHTTYKDNKFLPKSYIDNLLEMAKNNPAYFKIYAMGEFATLDKLVYTNWKVENFDYKKILKEIESSKAIFSLDFGFTNDPTAFVCAIIDKINKRLWVFNEFQEKGLLNNEIAAKITEMGFRKEVIVCDSAEPKSIEELRRNGLDRVISAIKGRDSILNGINLLQQYEIIIHPSCINIEEEFRNYTWQKDKASGEYINRPIDKYNHGLDALRYGVSTEVGVEVSKIKLLDRNLLF